MSNQLRKIQQEVKSLSLEVRRRAKTTELEVVVVDSNNKYNALLAESLIIKDRIDLLEAAGVP